MTNGNTNHSGNNDTSSVRGDLMSFKFSSKSKMVLHTVHPDLQKVAHRALEISRIDFGIPSSGGKRSAAEQKALFDEGKSKCDGYTVLSNHQSGNALDVYAFVDGKASWDALHLTTVAAAMLQAAIEQGVSLQWGGHWTSWQDMPHFELNK